ncbi:MAG: TetR/AcrR family transcriptional regulator [Acutalibacteraceae bacterium]
MPNFTKEAIKATFLKQLNDKPLSQITVKSIVEECGINRNSFYYHFQDIPALIEEMVTEEADRIVREHPTVDSIETALKAAVDFAGKNRRAILHIYQSVNRDIFEEHLWKVCGYVVDAYAENALRKDPIGDFDREVISRFYKCAFFGTVIEWMNERMPADIQSRIDRLCELQRGMSEEMIRRAQSK